MNMAMTPPSSTEQFDTTLALKVLTGKHAGAEHPLRATDFLLVGSSDDCEIIMTDEGIAPHHCLISRQGKELLIRPLDAAVGTDEDQWTPGQMQTISLGQSIKLGHSSIAIQPSLPAITAETAKKNSRLRLGWPMLGTLCSTLFILLLTGLYFLGDVQAYWPATNETHNLTAAPAFHPSSPAQSPYVQSLLGEFNALDTRLSSADVLPPGRDSLAQDVKEILRLSGIVAAARTIEPGRVEITGYFGDGIQAAAVVQSRAMREIEGLKQIVAVNLDQPQQVAQPATPAKTFPIVIKLVTGPDPYLVTQDGSRYYPGAQLPDGSVLKDIEAAHMVVEHQQKTYRVLAAGRRLNGDYLNTTTRTP